MNQNNRTVVELPSDRELLITRVFDAPRELVFRAHTDPALGVENHLVRAKSGLDVLHRTRRLRA